jgi:hypothetical protein
MKFDSKRGRNMDPKTLLMNKIYPKTIHGIFFLEYSFRKNIPKGSNFGLTNPMLFQMRAGNHLVIV